MTVGPFFNSKEYLGAFYFLRRRTFAALTNDEAYAFAVFQRPIGMVRHIIDMNEDIFAVVALNESITLASIEPLYCTGFFNI